MDMPLSERRQIENEMIFRRQNENVSDDLEKLDAIHAEEDDVHLMWDDSRLLNFKCECSDENCDTRIPLKLSEFKKIHENRRAFVIKPGHQVEEIEDVIISAENYSVVQKNKVIAEPSGTLNETAVDNS